MMDHSDKGVSSFQKYVLLLCGLAALSVGYYFVIALPTHNQARLELEREKFRLEQEEKKERFKAEQEEKRLNELKEESLREKRELDTQEMKDKLSQCVQEADEEYWSYVKLNGEQVEGKPYTYKAMPHHWDQAAKKKKAKLDECYQLYRR